MSFETPLPPYNASDPHATFVNASCLELLLIEMVPMAFRLAHDLSFPPSRSFSDETVAATTTTTATTTTMNNGKTSIDGEEDEMREVAFRKLDGLGYRVGQGLVERWVFGSYFG
ncbi:Trafficking protein particle complex subunit 33 [Bachmanniomyces sp. S44760]|nr:Trafficking protein particle complex subunit 33 [Bachmanniomyces sp. S44760]